MRKSALLLAVFMGISALPALAVQPDEVLPDPQLETRARAISKDLRCLVCQNESIDDSNADLARDLRLLVRKRLVAGDSDVQVKQYLVDRYGDYVLLNPPFKTTTLVLWFGPAVMFLAALGGAWVFARRRKAGSVLGTAAPASLSDEEKRRVAALLADGDEGKDA
ncbi:MAG TPA: cytochrome c-type biogenesis protein [Candidatus Sulfotelmatobacter sp.]|jgi:cytochrome c-type biogenesis protein CcmH|nr:cytochrome c-type biogenesis protein [Candidatus Sulfotelmatobacter sp.]